MYTLLKNEKRRLKGKQALVIFKKIIWEHRLLENEVIY